jgi:hypothetical protein
MNEYRNDARQAAKDSSWTFWRFLPLFLIVVVVLSGVGFVTKSLGLWGGTVVERMVFEESYQRSAALKASIAIDEAVITEINSKLTNPNLDEDTRYNLKAQASAARVRIATAMSQQ